MVKVDALFLNPIAPAPELVAVKFATVFVFVPSDAPVTDEVIKAALLNTAEPVSASVPYRVSQKGTASSMLMTGE